MAAKRTGLAFGWLVFGIGVTLMGFVGLASGDFLSGQAVPKSFPGRTALSYLVNGLILLAGLSILVARTRAWASAALTAYYALVVVLVLDVAVIARHAGEYVAYSNLAEQLAIAAGALAVFTMSARLDAGLAARLAQIAQLAFGVCAILFGGAHFFYMNMTAPLVPTWLPFGQEFWGYATGVFHILGGLAILVNVRPRLAAYLLAAMYASFTPFALLPLLAKDPSAHGVWNENAVSIALTGVAWVIGDSLARSRR